MVPIEGLRPEDPARNRARRWLEAAGLDPEALKGRPDHQLSSQALEASMAVAGIDVGILTPEFYPEEVAGGKLIQPFDIVCRDETAAHWLVYAESRRNAPKIRAFRNWILAEAGVEQTDDGAA